MRFDVPLMYGFGAELALDDEVRLLKPLLEIAVIVMDMLGDV